MVGNMNNKPSSCGQPDNECSWEAKGWGKDGVSNHIWWAGQIAQGWRCKRERARKRMRERETLVEKYTLVTYCMYYFHAVTVLNMHRHTRTLTEDEEWYLIYIHLRFKKELRALEKQKTSNINSSKKQYYIILYYIILYYISLII